MIKRILNLLLYTFFFILGLLFIIKFAGPQILRTYIQTGIGDCAKIPILCMIPQEEKPDFAVDKTYAQQLVPYTFPKTKISAPEGFQLVQELVKKSSFKKRGPRNGAPIIYLLHEPPNFFLNLFPQIKKSGISNNYEFWRNVMDGRESTVSNLDDAFFVIMKSIFTPDLGDQTKVKMIRFNSENRDYFINYNLNTPRGNFFDCSIFTEEGDFFKVYIKDKNAVLDLNKMFTILSTVDKL